MSGDQLDGPFGGYRGGKPAAEVPPPRRQPSGHPMVTLAERYAEVVKERDALVAEVRRLRSIPDMTLGWDSNRGVMVFTDVNAAQRVTLREWIDGP